jgi:hypothetical protein
MTSRSYALRTRRSRCPAASRSCSPRRSVPFDGRSRPGPILSWASFASPEPSPFRREPGFPGPTLLRFVRPPYGRGGARRSRALTNGRTATGLATGDNSLEVLHQNPALGFSREPWCSTDESVEQEHPCDTEPIRSRRTGRPHHPKVTPERTPKSLPGGLAPVRARGSPPEGPLSFTTLSKRNFQAGGPFRCQLRLRIVVTMLYPSE